MGGTMSGSAARSSRGSASGGPSMHTTSGSSASSAASTDRADPGPWWRMPSSRTTARLAGGSPAIAHSASRQAR